MEAWRKKAWECKSERKMTEGSNKREEWMQREGEEEMEIEKDRKGMEERIKKASDKQR
jgi:hypothetical protein